jgi:hypothetical protein
MNYKLAFASVHFEHFFFFCNRCQPNRGIGESPKGGVMDVFDPVMEFFGLTRRSL